MRSHWKTGELSGDTLYVGAQQVSLYIVHRRCPGTAVHRATSTWEFSKVTSTRKLSSVGFYIEAYHSQPLHVSSSVSASTRKLSVVGLYVETIQCQSYHKWKLSRVSLYLEAIQCQSLHRSYSRRK
jgi:hypothetical protein